MNFTTLKKKEEKLELYPGVAVLIQNNNVFQLNEEAMRQFQYKAGIAASNFITNGYDDDNSLILANLKMDGAYTNNITAKNGFSSTKLADRMKSQFGNTSGVYKLDIFEEDNTIFGKVIGLLEDITENNMTRYIEDPAVTIQDDIEEDLTEDKLVLGTEDSDEADVFKRNIPINNPLPATQDIKTFG